MILIEKVKSEKVKSEKVKSEKVKSEKVKSEYLESLSPSILQASRACRLLNGALTQLNSQLVSAARQATRRGLSLIEIMIALTMTLIILGAMMTAFQTVSREMQSGRAMIEMANRVRVLETTIRRDLSSLTVDPRPYTTTTPAGYFTISEGVETDATFGPNPADAPNIASLKATKNVIGDVDDYVSMTIQSKGSMFRGRGLNVTVIESPAAEVCYFTAWPDNNDDQLYSYLDLQYDTPVMVLRRTLLIYPSMPNRLNQSWSDVVQFFKNHDISARIVPNQTGTFDVYPNRLEDLAIRSNRFGHGLMDSTGVYTRTDPSRAWPIFQPTVNVPAAAAAMNSNRGFPFSGFDIRLMRTLSGPDDIVLTDVVGFDIKVFSPNAPVKKNDVTNDFLVESSDPGFAGAVDHGTFGGFVDLGTPGINGWLLGGTGPNLPRYFDTWTPAYENDGINQDFNASYPPPQLWKNGLDQGTNGLDDDNANGVDDSLERETAPPYPYPVRGIQIQVRVIERLTKQVHQTTIMHSFVPE